MDCFKRLSDAKIIPVAVIDRAQRAIPTALAMAEGGIDVMEITFRTAAAEDALCAVSKACPEILTGAGTVITLEQCRRAVDAGAQFIVSPGLDEVIVRWCTAQRPARSWQLCASGCTLSSFSQPMPTVAFLY